MTVSIYLRRSRKEEDKQRFSLDVQRQGCLDFVKRLGMAEPADVVEYVDDGKAGDDFHTRDGIRRLISELQRGDVIVCRDQSRLGRDALEVTLVVRGMVQDRGCRLLYYSNGQEVQFASALDQVTTFIQGTGHQMELEAIRSRTREALRSRVRAGRIAGGRCYGYQLDRKRDEAGRAYTVATVDPEQAEVIRRIYDEYLDGHGLKAIAHRLNAEGVTTPTVGRRGTGAWAPSAIRVMLRNPRYRGIYVHGKIKKVRRGGKIVRVKADPTELITLEVPEWRIVDDETWFAVQEIFENRGRSIGERGRPAAKYPLSGIGRCAKCGGSIGSARTKRADGKRVPAYACIRYHMRGRSACSVSLYQEASEVESALIEYLQQHVLTPTVVDGVLAEIRREVERAFAGKDQEADVKALESERKQARAEQRRLAKALAMVDDSPELLSELKQRQERIRYLDTEIAAAKRAPELAAELMAKVEATARDKLLRLGEALQADQDGLRQLFLSLFPDGLKFEPRKSTMPRTWTISGVANLGGSNLRGDPTGT